MSAYDDAWIIRLPKTQEDASYGAGRKRARPGRQQDDSRDRFASYSFTSPEYEPPIPKKGTDSPKVKGPRYIEKVAPAAHDNIRIKSHMSVPEDQDQREALRARRAQLAAQGSAFHDVQTTRDEEADKLTGIAQVRPDKPVTKKKGRLKRRTSAEETDEENGDMMTLSKSKMPRTEEDSGRGVAAGKEVIRVADFTVVSERHHNMNAADEQSVATEVQEITTEDANEEVICIASPGSVHDRGKPKEEEEQEGEEEEGQVSKEAHKVITVCEQISQCLREELRGWGHGQAEDRLDLTHMQPLGDSRHARPLLSKEPKRIDQRTLKQALPDVTLKAYQLVGVNWLFLLHQLEFDLPLELIPRRTKKQKGAGVPLRINGILADEMGLGKTVQTIAFLAYLNFTEPDVHTHLIVVPASVLTNWERELDRFAPELIVWTYHGSAKERQGLRTEYEERAEHVDVIITSYSIYQSDSGEVDRHFLKRIPVSYLILDEGHSVKNTSSQRFVRLAKQKTQRRILLSGTPVQNDVSELTSLLRFLNPHLIDLEGSADDFWDTVKEDIGETAALTKMKLLLAPFVLRRLKADVLDQLTCKTTRVEKVIMTATQRQVYEYITRRHLHRAEVAVDRKLAQEVSLPALELDLHSARTLRSRANEHNTGKEDAIPAASEAAAANADPEATESEGEDGLPFLVQQSRARVTEREAGNIFIDWRKVSNHPLLLRRQYSDAQVEEIARALHQTGRYGLESTEEAVLREIEPMCDYQLHELVLEQRRLRHMKLPASAIFDSCKCQCLKDLLPRLLREGHRCLIFSQWTRILDILGALLRELQIPALRLDGATKIQERQDLIDRFNAPDASVHVFLLSTRAGGLGINLSTADTVIAHDLDWNPAIDAQCEDRAHRIGQTRDVTVIKLVTAETVDERVYNRARRKKERTDALLDSGEERHRTNDANEISLIVQEELARWATAKATGSG